MIGLIEEFTWRVEGIWNFWKATTEGFNDPDEIYGSGRSKRCYEQFTWKNSLFRSINFSEGLLYCCLVHFLVCMTSNGDPKDYTLEHLLFFWNEKKNQRVVVPVAVWWYLIDCAIKAYCKSEYFCSFNRKSRQIYIYTFAWLCYVFKFNTWWGALE